MRITTSDVARAPIEEAKVQTPPATGFGALLGDAVSQASEARGAATAKVEALIAGSSDDIHGTMISVKEAEVAEKLVGTIRNRLLDAFHELWRTNV